MSQDFPNPVLRVWLLGGFRISIGERVLESSDIRLRAAQQIIKLLALAPDYRLHREQVLAAIWPEQEPQAAINSLNQALYSARRALDSKARMPFLTLRDQQLRLGELKQIWVDVAAFEVAARRARQQEDLVSQLAALGLYTGDLLPDDPYESWLDTRRNALRQTYRSLVLNAAALAKQPADVARVRAELQQALASDAADEELHRTLMRLAAGVGDRQAAIHQYALLERTLRHELQLEPDPLSQQLYQDIIAGRVARLAGDAPMQSVNTPPAQFPTPLTSFIGRRRELAEVGRLLRSTRLLTIAGAGGSGKTRLALEAARAEASAYADGACIVALAALGDPSLIDQELTRTLGLREGQGMPLRDQVIAFLAPRHMLLVLDNCEHVIDEAARLAETLLQQCPKLRLLATSREPLRIAGEMTWLIPALSLPDPRQPLPSRSDVQQYEAVQLFLDRATEAWAQFTLRDEEIPDLVQICTRLDGMPLAIELAAARVRTLTIAQIAGRLDNRFQLLRSGSRTALTRQQTLRAAIDWSYDLLSEPERLLFRRLAVFAGGWTLEAAESVCAGHEFQTAEVLPLLAQLIDKSLVVARDTPEGRRFNFLETIRQYALEQQQANGEATTLRTRHQAWYMQLATQGEAELTKSRQVAWLAQLAAELDNLRLAMQWSTGPLDDDTTWLQLAYRLYWFWYLHSAVGEGRAVFERALSQTAEGEQRWVRGVALLGSGSMALYQGELALARARLEASLPILRALDDPFSKALAPFMAGTVAVNQGDYEAAQTLLEECLPHFETLGHRQGVATALLHLGDVALGRDAPDEAETRYSRSLAIHRAETGSTWGMGQALNNLGEVARYRGDLAAAADFYHEALTHFQQLATHADVARALHNQAALALANRDLDAARARFRESVALFRRWGNCRGIAECIAGIAQIHIAQATGEAEYRHAATLLGFVDAYFTSVGAAMWPPDRLAFARARDELKQTLAPELLAAAWAAGKYITLEHAIATALELNAPT